MSTSSKRQRELARKRAERQAERRAERLKAKRRRTIGITVGAVASALVVLLAILVLPEILDSDKKGSTNAAPTVEPSGAAAKVACGGTKPPGTPKAQAYKAPEGSVVKGKTYTMSLDTSCGAVEIALLADKAPKTTASFSFLAGKKYFDGTRCHRLTTEGIKVLQCGDPTSTGSGGPGYQIPDENLKGATYPRGTVAMANSGPNTNGSQFFLVYGDTQLPPSYTVFGRITKGLDVLDRIAALGIAGGEGDGPPAQEVYLETVRVTAT